MALRSATAGTGDMLIPDWLFYSGVIVLPMIAGFFVGVYEYFLTRHKP
jgi:hypothetical protein